MCAVKTQKKEKEQFDDGNKDILDFLINNNDSMAHLQNLSLADLLKKLSSDDFQATAKMVILGLSITEILNEFYKIKIPLSFKYMEKNMETSEGEFKMKFDLSKDEMATLKMVTQGHTNQQIADQLGITIEAIAKRVKQILKKLNVDNRVQAAVMGAKAGII